MSFSDLVKQEIISRPQKDKCCKLAFLSGIIRGSGVFCIKDNEFGVEFKADSEELSMQISDLLLELFNYEVREVSFSKTGSGKDKVVIGIYGEDAKDILNKLYIISDNKKEIELTLNPFVSGIKKSCCIRSFIRGLYLSNGSCVLPNEKFSVNTRYHLELKFSHSAFASTINEELRKSGIIGKITRRKESYILYIKSSEEIKNFLAFINCPKAVLKVTDIMIEKEIINDSNRRTNCDLGNLNRQIDAAGKQIECINKIFAIKGKDFLSENMRKTAEYRLNFPDDTLLELSQRLNITKSCLNNRLREIVKIGQSI